MGSHLKLQGRAPERPPRRAEVGVVLAGKVVRPDFGVLHPQRRGQGREHEQTRGGDKDVAGFHGKDLSPVPGVLFRLAPAPSCAARVPMPPFALGKLRSANRSVERG